MFCVHNQCPVNYHHISSGIFCNLIICAIGIFQIWFTTTWFVSKPQPILSLCVVTTTKFRPTPTTFYFVFSAIDMLWFLYILLLVWLVLLFFAIDIPCYCYFLHWCLLVAWDIETKWYKCKKIPMLVANNISFATDTNAATKIPMWVVGNDRTLLDDKQVRSILVETLIPGGFCQPIWHGAFSAMPHFLPAKKHGRR